MNASNVLPFMTPPPQTSNATVAPTAPPVEPKPQFVSPPYKGYLLSQAKAIRDKGGSDKDVDQFFDIALARPGYRRAWVTFPDNPIENVFGDDTPSNLRGISMALLHGTTFGFGDDGVAAMLGNLTGVGASGGIEQYQRERDAWSKEHFKTNLVAEGVGMIAGTMAGVGALRGVGILAKAGGAAGKATQLSSAAAAAAETAEAPGIIAKAMQAAPAGAAFGAAFGASSSHDYDLSWDNLGDRTKRAILSGGIGAGIASGMAGVGAVVAPLASTAIQGLGTTAAVQRVANAVQDIPILGKLHEITPDGRAMEIVAKWAKARSVTAATMLQRAQGYWSQGQQPSMIDLLGDDFGKFAGEILGKRTAMARDVIQVIEQRQMKSGGKIIGQMLMRSLDDKKLGLANVFNVQHNLKVQRNVESKPFYTAAHQEVVQIPQDIRKQLLYRDQNGEYPMIEFWNDGAKLANARIDAGIDKGLIVPLLEKPVAYPMKLLSSNPADRAAQLAQFEGVASVFPGELPVRGFDYMNRNAREAYVSMRARANRPISKPQTKQDEEFQILQARLKSLNQHAEDNSESFRQGRGIWSGSRQSNDALQQGYDDFAAALPAEDVARRIMKLQPSDRDFYRLGAAKFHHEKLRQSDDALVNVAAKQFGGESIRFDSKTGKFIGQRNGDARRAVALFPRNPKGAKDFLRFVAGEANLGKNANSTLRLPSDVSAQKQIEANVGAIPPGRGSMVSEVAGATRQEAAQARTNIAEVDKQAIVGLIKRSLQGPDDLRTVIDDIGYQQSVRSWAIGSKVRNVVAGKAGQATTKMLMPPRERTKGSAVQGAVRTALKVF